MTTVLLAVDETDQSIEAVRQAHHLFGAEATYLAVNVAERAPNWTPLPMPWGAVYPYPYLSEYPTVEDDVVAPNAADHARETAREVTDVAGVDATPVGEVGDPVHAILSAAESHRADVIVVGSTDKGWWRRLFESSVSQTLARRSPVPVLIAGHVTDS